MGRKNADKSWLFFVNATPAGTKAKMDVDFLLSNWLSFTAFLILIGVYYLFLLSNGTFQLFAPELLDKAFNNMLLHLLHGEFTVDRQAIGMEAFTRDGKTYAYFGVVPAVLRLFAMPFTDIAEAQLARLSCLIALVIFVALQLRTLLIVHHNLPVVSRRAEFLLIMTAATVLSGPQLYILASAPIYYEPILWSAALAAGFNLLILRTSFGARGFRALDLVVLAALAGLAINTRASVGLALYLATMLLVAWEAWCRHISERREWNLAEILGGAADTRVLLPLFVLGLLAAVAAIINFERWGNPLIFIDFHYSPQSNPNDLSVFRNYGELSLSRLWIGALYYATGLPWLAKSIPIFFDFLRARYAQIGGPPIIPLFTNPLSVVLAGIGLYCLWWKQGLAASRRAILTLTLIGHASAVVLLCSAMTVALRYRFDLAPFMTLAGFIGYYSISVIVGKAGEIWQKRVGIAAVAMCVLGIISSHYALLTYKVWFWAVPMDVRLGLCHFVPFACHALGR